MIFFNPRIKNNKDKKYERIIQKCVRTLKIVHVGKSLCLHAKNSVHTQKYWSKKGVSALLIIHLIKYS